MQLFRKKKNQSQNEAESGSGPAVKAKKQRRRDNGRAPWNEARQQNKAAHEKFMDSLEDASEALGIEKK